ncbi:MAG: SAM-dependent methyltransferase, partial [Isosphaeraceae bacterium]
MTTDQARLEAFLHKMVDDMGAAAIGSLVLLGDKLGLYKTIAQAGPITSEQLARQAGTSERYVREWLSAQAAAGYVEYDPAAQTFSMTPEQAAVLAHADSPFFMPGGYHAVASLYMDEPKVTDAFRSGHGVGWHEHSACLFCGTERFFGPTYRAFLVDAWIPALDGVQEKLSRGARVADVGCGHGLTTLLMARAFPNSRF